MSRDKTSDTTAVSCSQSVPVHDTPSFQDGQCEAVVIKADRDCKYKWGTGRD